MDLLNCRLIFLVVLLIIGFLFAVTGLLIILTESSVHSILYLMFMFVYLTELTLILKMEFLALIFIIVYIGAVCVLMLFHIKLIKTFVHRFDNSNNNSLFLPFLFVSIILPLIQLLTLSLTKLSTSFADNFMMSKILFIYVKKIKFETNNLAVYNFESVIQDFELLNSTQVLGFLLYNIYYVYLIFGSLVLLVAMVGSIVLTLIKKKKKKYQLIHEQVFTKIFNKLILN